MANIFNMSCCLHMQQNSHDPCACPWPSGELEAARRLTVLTRAGYCAFPLQPNLETVRSLRLFSTRTQAWF